MSAYPHQTGADTAKKPSKSRWAIATILLVPALVLMIPLAAMQFTEEVKWGAWDFALFYMMMTGIGGAFLFIVTRSCQWTYRLGVALTLLVSFLIIWMNLAVGIMGDEGNPANLLFFLVLATGGAGAGLVQFAPRGMARVLVAMAVAQGLAPIIGMVFWRDNSASALGLVFCINAGFVLAFAVAAILFKRAARDG